jgi:DNA-binding protein H-NS
MDQITRLQKEAAAIQGEVIDRIRKEIIKYALTPEQLFGTAPSRRGKKPVQKATRTAKYADGAGNTWMGIGPRPAWLRQALEAGKALEDFLIGKPGKTGVVKKAPRTKVAAKAPSAKKAKAVASKPTAAAKKTSAKKASPRKTRNTATDAEAASS